MARRSKNMAARAREIYFRVSIYSVLGQVHPDYKLTVAALRLVDMALVDLARKTLAHCADFPILNAEAVTHGLRIGLGGQLFRYGIAEAKKATTRLGTSPLAERPDLVALRRKCGLQFDLERVSELMTETGISFDSTGVITLGACMEFLCADLLALGGNAARDRKLRRVPAWCIFVAIKDDAELRASWGPFFETQVADDDKKKARRREEEEAVEDDSDGSDASEDYCFSENVFEAARSGSLVKVQKFADKARFNFDDTDDDEVGHTAFCSAAKNGHVSILEELLRRGAKEEVCCDSLMTAVCESQHEVFRFLLARGARPRTDNCIRETVLRGHLQMLQFLVASGASTSAVDTNGNTLLHHAAQGFPLITEELLRSKCDPEARNGRGHTALQVAVLADASPVVSSLLKFGANASVTNEQGQTLMQLACSKGPTSLALIRVLLREAGLSLDSLETPDNTGQRFMVYVEANPDWHKSLLAEFALHDGEIMIKSAAKLD